MPIEVEIKKAEKESQVYALVAVSVNNGQPNVLMPEILNERTFYILAFEGVTVVGGIGSILRYSDPNNPTSEAEIDILTVEERFRGQGLEDLLLKRMLEDLSALKISRVKAIVEYREWEFYSRYGFIPDPRDPYQMIRTL